MLDITFKNSLSPQKGRVLISDPFAGDEYFERSVVYLCEHSEEGSFGFVLNNLIDVNLRALNEEFPDIDVKIGTGGPVETESMFFIHTLGEQMNESLLLDNGIYIGGDFEQLYAMLNQDHIRDHQVRFFLGYSGWGAGQLEEEIANNSWVVAEVANAREIMEAQQPDTWKYFMNKLGSKYRMMTGFPIDPNEN